MKENQTKTNSEQKTQNGQDSSKHPIFLNKQVEKYCNPALKERLKALILAKGMSQSDFYKSIGLGKDYWYIVSWGKINPALALKVRIAQALGVDSSVIWQDKKDGREKTTGENNGNN